MVVKFRNTIWPPPPQLSLHRRAALSSNSNGTRSVYSRENPKSNLYCEMFMYLSHYRGCFSATSCYIQTVFPHGRQMLPPFIYSEWRKVASHSMFITRKWRWQSWLSKKWRHCRTTGLELYCFYDLCSYLESQDEGVAKMKFQFTNWRCEIGGELCTVCYAVLSILLPRRRLCFQRFVHNSHAILTFPQEFHLGGLKIPILTNFFLNHLTISGNKNIMFKTNSTPAT
jgi:hypothetical protein